MSHGTPAVPKLLGLTSDRTIVQAFWIATFAILTAIGAQIEIPHAPVPFTLQTFFVLLAGGILGARNGCISMSLYLLLGIIGFPVFSSGGFGLVRLLGPTGGYLLAFPVAAFLVGYGISVRAGMVWVHFWMLLGLLVIFFFGTVQLALVMQLSWQNAFNSGFLLFSLWDITKLVSAAVITGSVQRRISATR